MRRFCLFMVLYAATLAWGEPPVRTPQDMARAQTVMLVRELGIRDSVLQDTLLRMHLKYAMRQQKGLTRQEAMQQMLDINAELKRILPDELYQKFMNRQISTEPRRPQAPIGRIYGGCPPPHPMHAEHPRQPMQPTPPPSDLP